MRQRRKTAPLHTGAARKSIPLYADVAEAIRKRDAAQRRGDFNLAAKLGEKVQRLQSEHLRKELAAKIGTSKAS